MVVSLLPMHYAPVLVVTCVLCLYLAYVFTQGGCRVSPVGYAHMTHMLSSLAAGKLILVLEVCLFSLVCV